ncbi:MAG: response regulator [Anaerolineae bacterium]|nr:response regulator [Anaerolineae bacterium]
MSTRILVVDDELDTLNLLRMILEISGFNPITTLNSTDAITLAETEMPDVALLDIMMPKLDGFTLCKMMRKNDATRELPIIFVTAYEALDIEERRVEAGADRVINKPIDMDVLVQAIKEMLEERAQRSDDALSSAAPDAKSSPAPSTTPPVKDASTS